MAMKIVDPGRIGASFKPPNTNGMTEEPESFRAEMDSSSRQAESPPAKQFKLTPFVWRDPRTIPPRPFLYGRHLIRGFVSATIGGSGIGKSNLDLVDAISMASGRSLRGIIPKQKLRVFYWGEDPREEIERRLLAICLHYDVQPEELDGYLFVNSGRDMQIVLAYVDKGAFQICEPTYDAMLAALTENAIDVAIIDPFVSSHAVSENDNVAIDRVSKAWADIATAANCAVDLVHHIRKNGGAEVTIEDARGAGSLIGTVRSARLLNPMTQEEAQLAQIDNRHAYFRVDVGKANLYLPPNEADWIFLESVSLGNETVDMPADSVGVATPWNWPDPFEGMSVADLRKVQEKVAAGDWAKNVQASDWVGKAVAEVLGLNINDDSAIARIKLVLKKWIKNGALKVEKKHDGRHGREKEFVVVGDRI